MRTNSVFVFVTALAAALQVAHAGDITGTVTLNGTPPPERPITFAKEDPNCGKHITEAPTTHFYVVGANKELADTIVMLKNVPAKAAGADAAPAVLDQKGCQYLPQIMAIQTGQKLLVRNSDPLLHNVHSVPTVSGNAPMNQAQLAGASDLSVAFPAAENFVKFQCDVHSGPSGSWMLAWVTIVDHPYFALTGKDGKFKISNVPPGKYTISALHRKASLTGVDKQIEVKDGAATTVDFTLEVPAAK
jgi:plastocyanin